ncbi:MAG: TSUP family transporter, partial [Acidimicrobiales bacterium]
PFLVLLVGPLQGVRLVNLLAVGINVLMLAREHRGLDVASAMRLLLPAAAVTPFAAFAVHRTDPALLSVIVGVAVLACAFLLASGRRAERLRGRRGMVAAGAVSAAMNTASGVGGPAVAMYALNAEWSTKMTRPTLQLYVLGLNALSFVFLGPVTVRPFPGVLLGAAIIAGYVLGMTVVRRLSDTTIRRAILALAVAGGCAAVIRGVARA